MDTVIPPDVVDQLRQLHADESSFEGWFRTEDLARVLGCGMQKARRLLRSGMRAGVIISDRRAINEQEAARMGMLGAGNTRLYRLRET